MPILILGIVRSWESNICLGFKDIQFDDFWLCYLRPRLLAVLMTAALRSNG
jgi:hypothetical protein